jgi:ABC-type multidrug transport system permease subunit
MAGRVSVLHPLLQLVLARHREFYRQPEAVFWVYVFPILMAMGLGIAFRERPVERFAIDVLEGPAAERIVQALDDERFVVQANNAATCRVRLRTGKTSLVVTQSDSGDSGYTFQYDPSRPESLLARSAVNDALQRDAGRMDPVSVRDEEITEVGSRYIDFLIPGLIGMNIMGGGLWGLGFVTVDMRARKLLKRFLATPMHRSHFLLSMMISRILFMIPEIVLIIIFARFAFGVRIYGSVWSVLFLVFLGSVTFSGVGLLVASRARTIEGVSGLMNLVMIPMWLLCGIFFSSDRFPDAAQPFIDAIPLTPLIKSLRAVFLEGATLASQSTEILLLVAYSFITFALALCWFRWK